jgi:predicted kinase
MKLIVVYGAPCSGKSTYVKSVITDQDLVYDYDELSRALTYGKHHLSKRELTHPYVIDIRLSILKRARQEEGLKKIYIISTIITDEFKEYIKDMNPTYHKMESTKEECLERLEKDDMRPDKEEWKEKIEEWFGKYQERSQIIKQRIITKTHGVI